MSQCTAPPGYYCAPLSSYAVICPENWYCPGGSALARRCPDDRWSPVASIYPEDCREHMNVVATVLFILIFMLASLGLCIWCAAWDWTDREDRRRQNQYCYIPPYGGHYAGHYGPVTGVYNKVKPTAPPMGP